MYRSTIRRILPLLLLTLFMVVPVSADLTVRQNVAVSGTGPDYSGESVVYIKGLEMRNEEVRKGKKIVTILDVENREMVTLKPEKKRAEVTDLSQVAEMQREIPETDVQVKLEPTGETREIAGETCNGYQMEVKVNAVAGAGMNIGVVISGPVWLAPGAPGKEEYAKFYRAMVEAGLFLGDPEAAKAQPGQQKGMSELYRAMAEKGVGYASELKVGFEGGGMMAKLMKKMSSTVSSEVQSVSTEPLSDDLFTIPSDFKVKRK